MFFFIQNLLSAGVWIVVAYLFDFSFWGWVVGLIVSYIAHEFIIPIFLIGVGDNVGDKIRNNAIRKEMSQFHYDRPDRKVEREIKNYYSRNPNPIKQDFKIYENIEVEKDSQDNIEEKKNHSNKDVTNRGINEKKVDDRIKQINEEIEKLDKPSNYNEFYIIFLEYQNELFDNKGISAEEKNKILMGDEGNSLFEEISSIFSRLHIGNPDNLLVAFRLILKMEDDLVNERFKDVLNMTGIKNEIMKIVRMGFRDTQEFKMYARINRIMPS